MKHTLPPKISDPIKPFYVASIQFNPSLNERDENISALLEVVIEAAKQGAKLIVTPEMATTGYHYSSRTAIRPFVDTIPGETTRRFEEVAKKYDTYIVIGMPEVDPETDMYYVAAALVGPEGVVGKYRKVHLWEADGRWAAWGDLGVPVYTTKLGKIAINICMDSVYPELARLAAVQGADILAFPTNSTAQSLATLQDRACANGLYVVSANRSNMENGYHMVGASAVWSPYGKKLAETAYVAPFEDEIYQSIILYAEIDPAEYANPAKERLKERRPELYQELMLYGGPWDSTASSESIDINAMVLQYEPCIGNYQENLLKVEMLLKGAVTKGLVEGNPLQLVVLPELSLIGPLSHWPAAKVTELAETESGPTLKQIKAWAVEFGLHIVCGFIEEQCGKLFNTAALLGPAGELIGKYHKTHLTEAEKNWATAGDEISVFSTSLGNIGLMIGYDAAFPEVAGVMGVKRADIIAVPSIWNGDFGVELQMHTKLAINPYPPGAVTCWDAIATGAQAYTLVANFIGSPECLKGRSGLYTLDPYYGLDQPVVASSDRAEAMMVRFSTIQNHWWLNQWKMVLSRRTFFYKPLVVQVLIPRISNDTRSPCFSNFSVEQTDTMGIEKADTLGTALKGPTEACPIVLGL